MNYQYRFGTSFSAATRTLYEDGGLRRYYQGIGAALIQGAFSLRPPRALACSARVRLDDLRFHS